MSGRRGASSGLIEAFLGPASTNPPSLDIGITAGVPLLSLTGDVGRTYILEYVPASAKSNSWQPLTTLLLTNNPQSFLDASAIYAAQRFYRARLTQ